jgi:HK97 family phage major capsid protein
MPEEFTPNDAKEALDTIREKMKKYGDESQDFKNALETTEKTLDAQEKKSEQIVKDLAAQEKAALDLKEQVDSLELELARQSSTPGVDWKESDAYKTLTKWIREGDKAIDADDHKTLDQMDQKTLRTDIDTGAGYLTMPEFDTAILRTIEEVSNVRAIARVRTTSKMILMIPVRTGIPTASYEGETVAGDDSESTYGSETLTAFRLTVTVPVTQDMLMDSSFDLEAEVNADVGEGMGVKEGYMHILGDGAKKPEGILTNPTVLANVSTSSTSGTLTAADLILMTGELKVGYNPMYGLNRKTLALIRTLEDSAGNPIFQMSLADKAPNSINGEPYMLLPDVPDVAASAYSIIYGDFMRGYTITDRTGLQVIRDNITRKKQAIVELTFHKWNTGQVVMPEAFHVLQIKS